MRKLFTITLTDEHDNVVAQKGVFLRTNEELVGQEYTWGIKGRELFRDALWHLELWEDFQTQRKAKCLDFPNPPGDHGC